MNGKLTQTNNFLLVFWFELGTAGIKYHILTHTNCYNKVWRILIWIYLKSKNKFEIECDILVAYNIKQFQGFPGWVGSA